MIGPRRRRQCDYNDVCGIKKFHSLITLYVVLSWLQAMTCTNAHLIQIEHDDFRLNGFSRAQLLSHSIGELSEHLPEKELTPAEYMVDLTNDLAYRILHYHSILNRNNFAFSPTALMSVLVAIYEGSTGRGLTELKNVLHLPNNNDIIRVGYRDIHRRLRTYFFDSDNPLKGLSLNKENITITRDYETVLMFYGYDLGTDMVSATTLPTTTIAAATLNTTKVTTLLETSTQGIKTTTFNIVTTYAPATTITPILTTPKTDTSTDTSTSTSTTTEISTASKEVESSEQSEDTTENITNKSLEESTMETGASSEIPTTPETPVSTTAAVKETNEAAELISSFVAEESPQPFSRIQKARVTRLPSDKLQAPLTTKTKPQANYLPVQRKTKRLTNRNKRHLLGVKDFESNPFVTLFNTGSQFHAPLATGSAWTGLPTYFQLSNDYEVEADPNFIPSSQTSAHYKQNYNTDVISHVFYLNNKHLIYTTYKVYNAVLYYKYFDQLKTSVLELELDTTEYNLIILLPDFNTDLVAAASALRSGPKLRLMRSQLKPKWVQAIIPDFKLHGTMFLTNDLQNLGICDIFEPNRADFRPMTDEKGIYVKHIEQSINVHIRTNPINQLRRNNGAQTQPIQISVNHPFMFFIIDRDLDVAVMAGRILNPLNVRVQ